MTYATPRKRLTATASQRQPTGLEAQEARCQREAARRGLVVTKVYRDTGSGLRTDHPGLSALCETVAAGEVRSVIVDSPNRLTRDADAYAALLAEWQGAGATLIVAGDSQESTRLSGGA